MDHFQEYKKQQEISEGIFSKIFGKDEPKVPDNPDFIENPDGTFLIGKNHVKEINTPNAIPFLKELDWKNSKLNFLLFPGTEFKADYINIDIKKQIIIHFIGEWISGPFYGKDFEGVFKENSTAFKGNFIGKYSDYEADPKTFLDGTFLDTSDSGILGIPNIVSLHKARNKKFNFIAIPAGNYLQFRSANGINGYIKIIKRLDEVSSVFQYEILDGFKGQTSPKIVNLPWDYFRQNWNLLFINPISPKNIAGLIQVPEGDEIIEMHISSAPATFKTEPENKIKSIPFQSGNQYDFNLTKLPIAIQGVEPEVKLSFTTPQEFEEFKKISNYINSGVFNFDIKNIQRAIQYGEVDGYGTFNFLSSLFNNVVGKNIINLLSASRATIREVGKGIMPTVKFKTPTPKKPFYKRKTAQTSNNINTPSDGDVNQDIISSMKRLNDFVKYFVANIVDSNGKRDVAIQTAIMNGLQADLGTVNIKAPVKSSKSTTSSPAKTTVKGLGLTEEARIEVRKIINDNF